MRKVIIAGNWKMNHAPSKALAFAEELKSFGKIPEAVVAMLFPPFVDLYPLREALGDTGVILGSQTMSAEDPGAFTGEISWDMLEDMEVKTVLIGHSERRAFYHENNAVITRKLRTALAHGFTPVLCVGENEEERKEGRARTKVAGQLHRVLKDLEPEEIKRVMVAYEPIWAIGTGQNATSHDAQEMAETIRQWCREIFGEELAEEIHILYGGSVKPQNVEEYLSQTDVDGVLVGGASLVAKDYWTLIEKGGHYGA